MKFIFVMLLTIFSFGVMADNAQTVGMPVSAVAAPVAVAPAIPAPVIASAPVALVPVAEPAAPPAWLQNLLVFVQGLPVIGPIAAKVFMYAGLVSIILTSLVAFLLGILSVLSKAFGSVGALQSLSAWIEEFKDGNVMYWLKFFSNFNAQKPDNPPAP